MQKIDPVQLLNAYAQGIFPMADSGDSEDIFWVKPHMRAVIALDQFHIPKSLKKTIKKQPYDIGFDHAFGDVVRACASPRPGQPETWINPSIKEAYLALFKLGYAHSVEAWQNGQLVGGLFGVHLGGAFFGESMFSHADNASKICLVALVEKLKTQNFHLLDTQFLTPHLSQFGAKEIPQSDYETKLKSAINLKCKF